MYPVFDGHHILVCLMNSSLSTFFYHLSRTVHLPTIIVSPPRSCHAFIYFARHHLCKVSILMRIERAIISIAFLLVKHSVCFEILYSLDNYRISKKFISPTFSSLYAFFSSAYSLESNSKLSIYETQFEKF